MTSHRGRQPTNEGRSRIVPPRPSDRGRCPGALLLAAALLSAATAGCGSAGPMEGPQSDLQQNRRLWIEGGPASYDYVIERQCFCLPEGRGPVRVGVTDGAVTSREYVDSDGAVPSEMEPYFPSVEGLFAFIEDAVERSAEEIRVTYDVETGVPVSIWIDYERQMADEEMGYSVRAMPEPRSP